MERTQADEAKRLQELADKLDCMTEDDWCLLTQTKQTTAEAWRKRGKGPSYLRIGNRVLYPRKAVAAHLETLTRERLSLGKALL
jgi:hypothetical protein